LGFELFAGDNRPQGRVLLTRRGPLLLLLLGTLLLSALDAHLASGFGLWALGLGPRALGFGLWALCFGLFARNALDLIGWAGPAAIFPFPPILPNNSNKQQTAAPFCFFGGGAYAQ
jgi:hypothetical protein